jgi:hypothetical protein
MRLLVVGKIETEVSTACKIAMKRGAKIVNASNIEEGFNLLLTRQLELTYGDDRLQRWISPLS